MGKRYAVTISFFQPGRPQAFFELDQLPLIGDTGILLVTPAKGDTVVFAAGHWSGVAIRDRQTPNEEG